MLLLGGYHCVKVSSDSETVRGMGLWEFSGALRELMLNCCLYTQLQKKPISHFLGQLWKSELGNENIFIPYSVAISSASFH